MKILIKKKRKKGTNADGDAVLEAVVALAGAGLVPAPGEADAQVLRQLSGLGVTQLPRLLPLLQVRLCVWHGGPIVSHLARAVVCVCVCVSRTAASRFSFWRWLATAS